MPSFIEEKIRRLLAERSRRKKDLAAFLGIAPQTMTDICKGRSAVTLPHLKGLVRFFELRADYWLDDGRDEPGPLDRLEVLDNENLAQLAIVLFGEPVSRLAAAATLLASLRADPDRVAQSEVRSLIDLLELVRRAASAEAAALRSQPAAAVTERSVEA